jgi:hypothetical protein
MVRIFVDKPEELEAVEEGIKLAAASNSTSGRAGSRSAEAEAEAHGPTVGAAADHWSL